MNTDCSQTHLLIPASGIGRRFGEATPKQYTLMSNGKTILDTTISNLLPLNFKSITIVLNAKDLWWQHSQYFNSPLIQAIMGGKERYHSVLNGVRMLLEQYDGIEYVAVHDGIRPLVDTRSITKLMHTILRDANSLTVGGLLVAASDDSIKLLENNKLLHYPREKVYRALTPQIYPLEILEQSLTNAIKYNHSVTDEANAIELLGYESFFIESSMPNIKITTKKDLVIANSLLNINTVII